MERRGEAPPERLAALELELRRAGLALDDFAAARSGRRTIDRDDPVEVDDLLEEQFATWQVVAGAFESTLLLGTLLPGAFVRGDRLRLAQAISNLVANAIEHGPGLVEISARSVGRGHVRIEVSRRGPGPALAGRRAHPPRPRAGAAGAAAASRSPPRSPVATAGGSSRRRRARGARIGLELPVARRVA